MEVFGFNHISNNLNEETEKTLKEFYKFYHKKWWCYYKAFRRYKMKSLVSSFLSAGSIISGAAAGGVTLNPLIIGVLTTVGILSKVVSNFKKYSRKAELSKYAAVTYKKVLAELRMYLRGGMEYAHEDFVKSMRITDSTIIDNCPEVEKYWEAKYNVKFKK